MFSLAWMIPAVSAVACPPPLPTFSPVERFVTTHEFSTAVIPVTLTAPPTMSGVVIVQ